MRKYFEAKTHMGITELTPSFLPTNIAMAAKVGPLEKMVHLRAKAKTSRLSHQLPRAGFDRL